MPGVPFVRASIVIGLFLFAAAFLAVVSTATADTLTYDIIDHPAAEADAEHPGFQDSVSGTMSISTTGPAGPLGSYTAGSSDPATDPANVDLAFSVTFVSTGYTTAFTYTGDGPLSNFLGSGTVSFTDTAVILSGYLNLSSGQGGGSYDLYFRPDIDSYMGSVTFPASLPAIEFNQTPATSLDPSPWTIAVAVPEPSALALLASALLGLGLFSLRRPARRQG